MATNGRGAGIAIDTCMKSTRAYKAHIRGPIQLETRKMVTTIAVGLLCYSARIAVEFMLPALAAAPTQLQCAHPMASTARRPRLYLIQRMNVFLEKCAALVLALMKNARERLTRTVSMTAPPEILKCASILPPYRTCPANVVSVTPSSASLGSGGLSTSS